VPFNLLFQHNSGNVENRMKLASFICSLLTHTHVQVQKTLDWNGTAKRKWNTRN